MMQSLTQNALRRRLIVAGIGGGVLWSKPIVRTVILPAHAECSPNCATMPTTTAEPVTERATVSSVTIMDGITAGTDSTFAIQDRGTTSITKVTLALDLAMNSPEQPDASSGSDMVITLTSPDSTEVTLFNRLANDAGDCSRAGWDIILDDTAEGRPYLQGGLCPSAGELTGTFRSATVTRDTNAITARDLLTGFNGQTPHGNWVLKVVDASASGGSNGASNSTLNSVLTVTSI